MIELAYPYIITHETFERDIKKLIGLGDKTLFKVIAPPHLVRKAVRDMHSDPRIFRQWCHQRK